MFTLRGQKRIDKPVRLSDVEGMDRTFLVVLEAAVDTITQFLTFNTHSLIMYHTPNIQ